MNNGSVIMDGKQQQTTMNVNTFELVKNELERMNTSSTKSFLQTLKKLNKKEELINRGYLLIDNTYHKLLDDNDNIQQTMLELFAGLYLLRKKLTSGDWKVFSNEIIKHPLKELIHSDPLTRRAFEKPRGYAGDAVMIDLIYFGAPEKSLQSRLAKEIHHFCVHSIVGASIRERARIVGETIDNIVAAKSEKNNNNNGTKSEKKKIRVLSIACGHSREPTTSKAFMQGKLDEFVAFDQDPESLKIVKDCYGHLNVTTVNGSVRDLLKAERLTEIMFSLTKPGGKMYVTNMTDTVPASGYMETYMGWNLIYRTPSEIEALGQGLNRGEIESKRIFVDRTGCVGFLEIDKAEKEGNFNFFLSSL
ncbi:hypothetical protein ABK040_015394 [Willaertia magna]